MSVGLLLMEWAGTFSVRQNPTNENICEICAVFAQLYISNKKGLCLL